MLIFLGVILNYCQLKTSQQLSVNLLTALSHHRVVETYGNGDMIYVKTVDLPGTTLLLIEE